VLQVQEDAIVQADQSVQVQEVDLFVHQGYELVVQSSTSYQCVALLHQDVSVVHLCQVNQCAVHHHLVQHLDQQIYSHRNQVQAAIQQV
jgi:hypothetical protein